MNTIVFNEIHPFKSSDNKWGYKQGFNTLIKPKYQGAMPYNDGICWVKQVGWGAINLDERVKIPFIYKHIQRIAEKRYIVCSLDGYYGIIDNTGKRIIELIYDSISQITDNIFSLEGNGNVLYCNRNGEYLFNFIEEPIELINPHGSFIEIISGKKTYYIQKEGTYFFVDKENKYYHCTNNNDYIVITGNYDDASKEFDLLVYSAKGELVLTRHCVNIYSTNIFIVNDNLILLHNKPDDVSRLIFISMRNHQKKEISHIKNATQLNQDYICIQTIEEHERVGIVDSQGKTVIPCVFKDIGTNPFSENVHECDFDNKSIMVTMDGEKWGVIDFSQNVLIPYKYDRIAASGILNIKSYITLSDNLWGVVDLNNNIIIENKYQELGKFYNNYSIAKLNDLYGVINEQDKTIIPFVYNHLERLSNGYYIAQINKRYTVLDKFGNETFCNKYSSIESFKSFYAYKDVVMVKSWEHWGYVDMYGEETVPCCFSTKITLKSAE